MNIEQAFQLIEENIDQADFCGPIDKEKIASAEDILGIKFPKSYSLFLQKFGAGDIAGIEIFGIIKDPTTDGQSIPNGIWLTLDLRERLNLQKEYLVVSETGYGPYYVIDTSITNESSESPVYMWSVSYKKEKVADSFGEFLFEELKESV